MQQIHAGSRENPYEEEQSQKALIFSCEAIDLFLQRGAVWEGSFRMDVEEGRDISGRVLEAYITTTDARMECLTPYVSGKGEDIFYCFHGEHLDRGETIRGEFQIVSSLGEYRIPFCANVEGEGLESSIGRLTCLTHFTNLAKSNWQEAVSLFYREGFEEILEDGDRLFYRALSGTPGNGHNVEEFLLSTGRKPRVEYTTQEAALSLTDPGHMGECVLTVLRNGWGHTDVRVETEGDFLFTEVGRLDDGSFSGNLCQVPVYVDGGCLHGGRNFGRVHLVSDHSRLTIPVMVRVGAERGPGAVARHERKKLHVRIVELYIRYRTKRLSREEWQEQTGLVVERLLELDGGDISAKLFQVQLLIGREGCKEAEWIMGRVGEELRNRVEEEPELWAYYQYLASLLGQEDLPMEEYVRRVKDLYRSNRSSWRIGWLLLFLSEEYSKSTSGRWLFLENQWKYGCRSPIMYLEGLLLLLGNPLLLRKLEDFEIQILWFGARHDLISQELADQILVHAGKVREFSSGLYRILARLWTKRPDDGYLHEICALLIKGGKTGRPYFPWYKLGVEKELRITRLYEFYMLSVDVEVGAMLPRQVLMYFSYQDHLDYERTALLYSCVTQCRDQYPELYGVYKNRINLFVLRQVQKEHMNRDLAYLYRELLTSTMVGEHNASALCHLFFAYEVWWEEEGIQRVIVYQPGNGGEMSWPANGKRSWVPVYGDDSLILLEDQEGNRLAGSARISREKLMNPGRLLNKAVSFVKDNPALDIYMCGIGREWSHVSASGLDRVERVCTHPSTEGWLKRELTLRLARYLCGHEEWERLGALVEGLEGDLFTGCERAELAEYMIRANARDKALEWMALYGPYGWEANNLSRLLTEQIEALGYQEDDMILDGARYAFVQGRRDSLILTYLCLHLRGLTGDLCRVWREAGKQGIDRSPLTERILDQLLFGGGRVGDLDELLEEYTGGEEDSSLVEGLVEKSVEEYLAGGQGLGKVIAERLYQHLSVGKEDGQTQILRRMQEVAFLKWVSEEGCPSYMEETAGRILGQLLGEGIRFNFFRRLPLPKDMLWELDEETIIEYKGRGGNVRIHYALSREDWQSDWMVEEMLCVYPGSYIKTFPLFFGEKLVYRIEEEAYGEVYQTQTRETEGNMGSGESGQGAYGLVNRMLISGKLGDVSGQARLLEGYEKQRFLSERLFETR